MNSFQLSEKMSIFAGMKTIFRLFFLLFLLTGCVVDDTDSGTDSDVTGRVRVGDRLPSFTVDVISGDSTFVFSSNHLVGNTVIVFFHTGCIDCQRELPELDKYYQQHLHDPGFQMIAIAREESEADIAAFWQENGLTIPYSPQPDRTIFYLFADMYIPRAYMCSQTGIVTWVGVEKFDVWTLN